MIAKIVLNRNTRAIDSAFDYLIPDHMNIKVGMRVAVPFGAGNKTEEGYVVGIAQESEFEKLKPIVKLLDSFIYFDDKGVKLAEFMRHRYFCMYSEAIKCLLPPNVSTKFRSYFYLKDANATENDVVKHSVVYERIVCALKEHEKLSFEEMSASIKGRNLKAALNELKDFDIVGEYLSDVQSIKDTEITVVRPACSFDELSGAIEAIKKKAPKQAAVLELVCDYGELRLSELLEICDTTHATVNTLVKKGLIYLDREIVRSDVIDCDEYEYSNVVLTVAQQEIVNTVGDDIENNACSTYLLHGVTGSGKTEIYLNLVEKCIKNNKNAIFLVPEISLTPQMIRQVVARFGENVAVLHSSLTIRERYDQWKKIKCGEVQVVVGARSAVFAPFDNVGLIIIDEEHEGSYKSEMSPKYSTVEIARYRTRQNNSVLLLASATPSVESYYLASTGKIKLLELKNRVNNSALPDIDIIDMRQELRNGNTDILSAKLKDLIAYNIEHGLKTILFLNRRGYSGFIQCRSCGHVIECPNCNISMTYHKRTSSLVCHYCDYKTSILRACPKCGSDHIKFSGDGTQKVEDELLSLFPGAKILRMDADTTASRNAHEQILSEFAKDESDILIGTQMITKGLDFEKVTLVGVLAADMSLNINDFRSDEKTFDLITQVCGRAGRGKYGGRAVIQTYDPGNETIQFSKTQDYNKFYNREIEVRRLLVYPPFCEIINFIFTSDNEYTASDSASKFHNMLKDELTAADKMQYVIAYKVMQAPIYRINNNYRYRFIMKLTYSKAVYEIIHSTAAEYRKLKDAAGLIIDANPHNMY